MTVETVNQYARWANLLILLTEHANLIVYHSSSITSDAWPYVLTATMLTPQVIVYYRHNAILAVMLITGLRNVSVLAQVDPTLIPTQDSASLFVLTAGMEMLILAPKHA